MLGLLPKGASKNTKKCFLITPWLFVVYIWRKLLSCSNLVLLTFTLKSTVQPKELHQFLFSSLFLFIDTLLHPHYFRKREESIDKQKEGRVSFMLFC